MLNPRYQKKQKNGKFWCNHNWLLIQECGTNWYLWPSAKHLCKCIKCGKQKYRSIADDESVPDNLIVDNIDYR